MFSSHHFLIRGQSSAYLNDCSLVPSFAERILGIGRLADQRRAAAQLNAPHLCLYSSMMCLIKSWRDVEEGEEGESGGMRMLLRKIWLSFLCASMWTHRFAECFHTSQHTLSFSFPFSHGHNHIYTERRKKNKGLALFLHSLAGDPEAEPGGRETQLLFPAPKPLVLANEKRDCPIRFHCGQTTRLS